MVYAPLPENENVSAESLQYFLQALLTDNCDKIWYCRHITAFIDDQKPSEIKVIQVDSLTKQVTDKILLPQALFFLSVKAFTDRVL